MSRYCPLCKHDSRVYDSRTNLSGYLKRRRICLDRQCAHRWTTYEVTKDEFFAIRRQPSHKIIFQEV
jgi:transcriptional regulator NrdR family protein